MPRFFIEKSDITDSGVVLRDMAHIKALRLRVGDEITVCDGDGMDFFVRLIDIANGEAHAELLRFAPSETEASVRLAVFLAFAKGDRAEYAIQKCTELGASEFFLFPSERVVANPDAKSLAKKLVRLNAVAKSAAEQSGRGRIPTVAACNSFKSAVTAAAGYDLPLLFYENEQQTSLTASITDRNPTTISIMTGAEGGFSPREAAYATDNGMKSLTLGKRILRCDTAPIAATAAVMLLTGNL